jgi:predicted dehydrogenase
MSVNVVVVGLGYWGPNLARNVAATEGACLYGLCDSSAERLEKIGREYPVAKRFAEYSAVLGDSQVHAVVICTPVASHFELAAAALRAGKHVLVEKPLAKTADQCRQLIALSRDRGLALMSGHVFVYNQAVRKVKEYIDSGALGQIYYVYSQRLNLGILRQDVNALWNFAPHDLSILNYWLGNPPTGVVVRGYSYIQPGIEDVVFMTLDYPKSIGANVHISWLDPRKVRTMTVVGSERMVVYDDVSADARLMIYDKGVSRIPSAGSAAESPLGSHNDFGQFQLLLRSGDITIPKVDFSEPLRAECRHFVECITTGKRPMTDGEEGLRVVATLESAQRSLEQRGQWVAVPSV